MRHIAYLVIDTNGRPPRALINRPQRLKPSEVAVLVTVEAEPAKATATTSISITH